MITASLLLILVAAVLVVVGLLQASDALLFAAIALSGLAAVLVYLGSRRSAAAPAPAPAVETQPSTGESRSAERLLPAGVAVASSGHLDGAVFGGMGNQALGADSHDLDLDNDRDLDDLDDRDDLGGSRDDFVLERARDGVVGGGTGAVDLWEEPPAQVVTPAAALRLSRLSTEVLVIDGRPRYHLQTCSHLVGQDDEPLPVSEAQSLGFTPCDHCKPVTALAGSS